MSNRLWCERPLVTVVVPTLNEAGNVSRLYSRLVGALESSGIGCFEILFVDDGSTDGTIEEIESLSKSDPRVRLVVRKGEKGLAKAIAEGLRLARGRIAVVMDADLQHPPEKVPELVKAVESGYDIVVGSRYSSGGGVEGWSLYRRVISLGAVLLAWVLMPESRRSRDPVSGFFAVNLERVSLDLKSVRGFKVLVELLFRNPYARVKDVPYVFRTRSRGQSKLGVRAILDYLLQLLALSSLPRFMAVGALGSIVNLAIYSASMSIAGVHELSSIAGFEAGVVHNMLWHERFTFSNRSEWRKQGFLVRLLKYNASSMGGIGVGIATSIAAYRLFDIDPLVSQALGILAGFAVNFALASRYVWK